MKIAVAPWKHAARHVLLVSAQKWRSNLTWELSAPSPRSDHAILTLTDGLVTQQREVSLRTIWKGACRRDFRYLQACGEGILDDYYKAHEARQDDEAEAAAAAAAAADGASGIRAERSLPVFNMSASPRDGSQGD